VCVRLHMRVELLFVWQALVEELQDGEKSHEEETDVGAVVDGGENAPLDMVVEEVEDSCPECNGAGCDSCKGRYRSFALKL
jgi:hypothetical protein